MKSDDNFKINNNNKEVNEEISCKVNMSAVLINNNTINSDSMMELANDSNINDLDNFENSSRMQGILKEFTQLYSNKISRIDDVEDKDEEWLKKKNSVLESWVEDLGEQNSVLVSTVEHLEKEAKHRVSLLQEQLEKMALVTKESCISLRDHQIQVDSLVTQKIETEDAAQKLREKIISLEQANSSMLQENFDLKDDLESLIEVITVARTKGRMDLDRIKFKHIVPAALFGSDFPFSLKDFIQRHSADGCKSAKMSLSSLGSPGSTDTEGEKSSKQRSADFKALRRTYKQTNALLVERDKHIADLQSQITDLHHQLAVAQTHVDNTTSTLHSLRDRGRYDTLEIHRRDDMIRHLLSPKHSDDQQMTTQIESDVEASRKSDLEMQLSHNIDVLAAKLTDLEEECRQLKHQNEVLKTAHSHCVPIINQLQDQLGKSNKTIQDLRSVLTEEVAERHEQIISLKNQLHKTRELHQEALNELHSKKELVQQLKEFKFIEENKSNIAEQSYRINTAMKDSTTQTDKINKTYESDSSSVTVKISKLENELSEKNILLRELQNHLSTSRKELYLKDETLYNVEQKLNLTRRGCDEKDDRMTYLTSQLTSLQLEVSRLHGTVQQLRAQLDSKATLVKKLETENESLCWQLNEKSSTLEKLQKEISSCELEMEKRKKEIRDQKLTIGTLQDALVSTKQTCDKLRKLYDLELDEPLEHDGRGRNENEWHLEDENIIHLLKLKLEEAKKEGKIIAAKCSKMDNVPKSELNNFVDQLIRIQNNRLRCLKKALCSCNAFRQCSDNSQILELVALMEDVIDILEESQHLTLGKENVRRKSFSREPSQYSNFSINYRNSSKLAKENSSSLANYFIMEGLEKEHLKFSQESLSRSRRNESLHIEDNSKLSKETNLKSHTNITSELNVYNDTFDNQQDAVASVRKWLQRQKLPNTKLTETIQHQKEQMLISAEDKRKSADRSCAKWKLPVCRNCQTRFCSCELSYRGCLDNATAERDFDSSSSLKRYTEHQEDALKIDQITRLKNQLQRKDRSSNCSKTSGGNVGIYMKTLNECQFDAFQHLLDDLEEARQTDDLSTE